MKQIATIRSDFQTKFGIPRQSSLVKELRATIVFDEEYRDPEALRGLNTFSHIWLLWGFSQVRQEKWTPTVRPPRLGGNVRMGVFATRSPFRPNPIGLSVVAIDEIEAHTPQGPLIHVCGADLMDGTPIYDIKPYLPYVDCIPEAKSGFVGAAPSSTLRVEIPDSLLSRLPERGRRALPGVLAQDPRPSYQDDPLRVYGMGFAGFEVKFRVEGNVLTVLSVEEQAGESGQRNAASGGESAP